MKINRNFTEKSDGIIEFTPIAEGDARIIYNYLRDHLSYLRKKINQEQNLLDITPKENENLLKGCLKNLIMFKADLEVTENKFESVKRWFDKNNLPYPGSHKDRLKIKRRELLEDYISRKAGGKRKKDWNGTIYGLADEMRYFKDNNKFQTYREAYQWCEENYTVNGKPITWKQLEKNYDKAKYIGKVD
jgi:hypothetical protein